MGDTVTPNGGHPVQPFNVCGKAFKAFATQTQNKVAGWLALKAPPTATNPRERKRLAHPLPSKLQPARQLVRCNGHDEYKPAG